MAIPKTPKPLVSCVSPVSEVAGSVLAVTAAVEPVVAVGSTVGASVGTGALVGAIVSSGVTVAVGSSRGCWECPSGSDVVVAVGSGPNQDLRSSSNHRVFPVCILQPHRKRCMRPHRPGLPPYT